MELTPFIKWAGGKRALMNELVKRFPKSWNNYYEPFLGGGSVMMKVLTITPDKPLVVSDISEPLIMSYRVIKDSVEDLITELTKDQYQWVSVEQAKQLYLENRNRFNRLKILSYQDSLSKLMTDNELTADQLTDEILDKESLVGKKALKIMSKVLPKSLFDVLTPEQQVEMTALFIFLNKVGFNGMYRENTSGLMNIPHGRTASKPTIFTREHLIRLSDAFKNVTFKCCNYVDLLNETKEGDFVYLDPPYAGEAMFKTYTKTVFDDAEQVKLCEAIRKLHSRGVKVMLSNSATQTICDMYEADEDIFKVDQVNTKRMLGAKSESRKNVVKEVIVYNYR